MGAKLGAIQKPHKKCRFRRHAKLLFYNALRCRNGGIWTRDPLNPIQFCGFICALLTQIPTFICT
jgi:hypothetical protein